MAERIYKLQPDRTVYLQGFDHLGASAAIYEATPDGFKVRGHFQDAADFAVVVLYDADNFFEHPRLKYLPDFQFEGIVLEFDVRYQNLMPLNCRKYATIDWPYLVVQPPEGDPVRIRLADHAEVISDPDQPAQAEFHIQGAALQGYDRLTLWYLNMAFDYVVPGKVSTEYAFYAGTPGTVHWISVADRTYAYVEQDGDTSAAVAAALISAINGAGGGSPDADVSAEQGSEPWTVLLRTRKDDGSSVVVSTGGVAAETLYHVRATTVCRALADQINAADYASAPFGLSAEADGTVLRIRTIEGGYDANFVRMYAVWKSETLRTAEEEVTFSGGASTAVLRVRLDFAVLGVGQIRRMWLTLAPRLANAADFTSQEWLAEFFHWQVSGPEEVRRLRVAGPGSVLVESMDAACQYEGPWTSVAGFYPGGLARVASTPGTEVTVRYTCPQPHDLWVWTSLGPNSGSVQAWIDGAPAAVVSARMSALAETPSRRQLASGLPAGLHTVRLVTSGAEAFVFAGLEAVVAGDVPDPVPGQTWMTPALDYSTDHAYKLPPARILWNLRQLGCAGELNQYLGIFWWNQRRRVGGYLPEVEVEFSGQFLPGDSVFLRIGDQIVGKSVLLAEAPEIIARHFCHIVNATSVGLWARTEGRKLVIRARSAAPAYQYEVETWVEAGQGSTGSAQGGGWIRGGDMGRWEVDVEAPGALNTGAAAWHQDLYQLCAAEGRAVITACSMELVEPPAQFAARFPDGSPVVTDMGFGGFRSTHCAFGSGMLEFHKKVFLELASRMQAAGLVPRLQMGEFTWWYFTNWSEENPAGGMAYYDDDTRAAALTSLGRELRVFRSPDDDPQSEGAADAVFLRNRLRDYAAALAAHVRASYPQAELEVLFPYDVNHPSPAGVHHLGGRLNYFVNLPLEWRSKAGSGFDRFKIEALDFSAWSRNLDLARQSLEFAAGLQWPRQSLRAMIAVFRGGSPWQKEAALANQMSFAGLSLWAFDHVCLYGWRLWEWGSGKASAQG